MVTRCAARARLGFVAAALDFVPFVGPILAAMPAVLVVLGSGLTDAAHVALLYLSIQIAEGYVHDTLDQAKPCLDGARSR